MEILPTERRYRPAELRSRFFDTRFGTALIAVEPEAGRIAWISLVLDKSAKAKRVNLDELTNYWEPERLLEGNTREVLKKKPGNWIFEPESKPAGLLMKGTQFQHSVWNALQEIPMGETRSYSEIAEALGRPKNHARAVASAVAANTLAVLVPCHRVIQANGKLSGFRWGAARKQMLLDWEAATTQNAV